MEESDIEAEKDNLKPEQANSDLDSNSIDSDRSLIWMKEDNHPILPTSSTSSNKMYPIDIH